MTASANSQTTNKLVNEAATTIPPHLPPPVSGCDICPVKIFLLSLPKFVARRTQ